jgi:hypothetical protein
MLWNSFKQNQLLKLNLYVILMEHIKQYEHTVVLTLVMFYAIS